MINKCKVLMTSRGLYKGRNPHEEGDLEKKRKEEQKKERKTVAFYQEQRCTHTSPRTEYPMDMKEIFLCSIVVKPKVN